MAWLAEAHAQYTKLRASLHRRSAQEIDAIISLTDRLAGHMPARLHRPDYGA